jgi:hypothetical protein
MTGRRLLVLILIRRIWTQVGSKAAGRNVGGTTRDGVHVKALPGRTRTFLFVQYLQSWPDPALMGRKGCFEGSTALLVQDFLDGLLGDSDTNPAKVSNVLRLLTEKSDQRLCTIFCVIVCNDSMCSLLSP